MIIKAENTTKQFLRETKDTNIFYAVRDVSFELDEKCLSVVKGRSGSGKSTLMAMLSGLLPPSEGKVFFRDTDIYGLDDGELSALRNESFGFIPQGQSAVFSLNVMENILLPYTMFGKEGDTERAAELMKELEISRLASAMPRELSGGEMRRVAIARALIKDPPVVFADEPTGDLDDESTEIVLKLLKKTAEKGAAVMLVTHEAEAGRYADEMYNMTGGELKKL